MNIVKPAIIFDMDGTLFQTETIAIPAFRNMFTRLQEAGMLGEIEISDRQIESVFGMTIDQIWDELLPHTDELLRKVADQWLLEEELALLEAGAGALYPGVKETLATLVEKKWPLFIASNGIKPYVEGIVRYYELSPLFQGIYTGGDSDVANKAELVHRLCVANGVSGGYMVGDRYSDVEAGRANQQTVIGCNYEGFPYFGDEAELADADYIIPSFHSILSLLPE
ncbi:HAD family hydrolase [Mechercharimyces sp. CAU 1602]|uniref:HAD family hydrolase n=1 Tax=Mechercharimyces sp. CAU 1602 TaxID=2973933 RepID=UPI002162C7C0|nr:HAD hydrolase-like protein [Mechercharimyces sp. CAU 1602]MCS1352479.1 HAD hydrolase-like protein [Mechercharimyces sp. CAU 1602]